MMHSEICFAVFFALCAVRGVFSAPAPLEITHPPVTTTGGTPDKEQTENLARLKTAETDANRHILKMEHVLNNPTVPQNAEMIQAAFGKNAKVDEIKNTVQTLKTGKLPVTLHTDPDPTILAAVRYDTSTHPAQSGNTYFGKDFHNPSGSGNMRAATLVHEATHKLSNTGDTVDKHNKMIPGNDFRTPESGRYGYATSIEPAKTPAELNKDKIWTGLRDGTAKHPAIVDLENNAESYAQFGSMCDTAISNAAVGLRRRALEERDWETAAIYLIRRQACTMRKKAPIQPAASSKAKLSPTAKAKLGAVSKLVSNKNAAASKAGLTKSGTVKPLDSGASTTGPRKYPLASDAQRKSRIPVASASSAKAPSSKKALPGSQARGPAVKSRVSRIPVSRGRSKAQTQPKLSAKIQTLSKSSSKSRLRPTPPKGKPKGLGRPAVKYTALQSRKKVGPTSRVKQTKKAPVNQLPMSRTPTSRPRAKASTKLPISASGKKSGAVLSTKPKPTVTQKKSQPQRIGSRHSPPKLAKPKPGRLAVKSPTLRSTKKVPATRKTVKKAPVSVSSKARIPTPPKSQTKASTKLPVPVSAKKSRPVATKSKPAVPQKRADVKAPVRKVRRGFQLRY